VTNRFIAAAALVACVLGSDKPAFAQTIETSRPFVGLFGRKAEPQTVHSLDLSAVIVEAYDDDVLAETTGGTNPLFAPTSGYYTMFQGNANYSWQRARNQFGATAASVLRYYHNHDLKHMDVTNFTAGAGYSSQFTERIALFLNQTVSYSPSVLYRLFPEVDQPGPGDVPSPGSDYQVSDSESYYYSTAARLTHKVSRRGALSVDMLYSYTNYVREIATQRDARTIDVHGQFARNLSRNSVARFGYRYRNGEVGFGVTAPAVEHGIDVGIDYARPLSATRRALFGFSFGTSAVGVPETLVEQLASREVYRMTGNVMFGYQFGRSWQAKATYRRGLDYIPELSQPVFSDGVTTVLEGLLTPRLDLLSTVGYSNGESAFVQTAATFLTYTANVRLRYGLTRLWALQVEGLYYYYDFSGRILPLGVPPTMERTGIRGGLTMWIPALRR
jgi:hypothetical protein